MGTQQHLPSGAGWAQCGCVLLSWVLPGFHSSLWEGSVLRSQGEAGCAQLLRLWFLFACCVPAGSTCARCATSAWYRPGGPGINITSPVVLVLTGSSHDRAARLGSMRALMCYFGVAAACLWVAIGVKVACHSQLISPPTRVTKPGFDLSLL